MVCREQDNTEGFLDYKILQGKDFLMPFPPTFSILLFTQKVDRKCVLESRATRIEALPLVICSRSSVKLFSQVSVISLVK